ncbi:MAG: class I SAM-dependent methyltransferase [Candidatus Daviesbacteria bacterium]|nr:class I SAM-dependent methyltransferase [Candidatus Daviesbacteria bacterium]
MRTNEEIIQQIERIIKDGRGTLELIESLLWGLLQNEKLIRDVMNRKINQSNNILTSDILAMYWLLKNEDRLEDWVKFQEMYHTLHNGPPEEDFRAKIFHEWMGSEKIVLDIGVHTGKNTNFYGKNNTVKGVDLPGIINKFSQLYHFPAIAHNLEEGLTPFKDDEFDVVVAGEIMEHIINIKYLFQEIHRVLKPGGIFMMSSPFENIGEHDPLHCHFVNEKFITEQMDGLFNIEEIKEELKVEKKTFILRARSLK